jgi:hypothetical protein
MGDVGIRATEASAVECRREDDEMAMVVMMMRARVGQRRESADGLCLLGEGDGRVRDRELVKACFVRRRRVFQALYRPADPCVLERVDGVSEDVSWLLLSRLSCRSAPSVSRRQGIRRLLQPDLPARPNRARASDAHALSLLPVKRASS